MATKNELKQYVVLVIFIVFFTIQIVSWSNNSSRKHMNVLQVVKVDAGEKFIGCHKKLRLVDPPGVVTALATVPGSGNTWTRHLIQEATGYQTGSVFHDAALLHHGFPGEGIRNGSVIVVKSHFPIFRNSKTRLDPAQNLIVVRHPIKAIASELTRQATKRHSGGTWNSTKLGTTVRKKFDVMLRGWSSLHNYYLKLKETQKTLLISYSRLKSNTREVLEEILNFLDIKKSERFISCAVKNSEGPFHRKNHWSIEKYVPKTMALAANQTAKHFEELLGFSLGYD